MRRLLASFLLCIAAASAGAETVPVRSGEHPGHSRLVVEFRDTPDWRLIEVPAGRILRIGRGDVIYDLTSVFRYIPRTRIGGLRQDPGTGDLVVELACACTVEAFQIRRGAIVIDVSGRATDGTPRIAAPTASATGTAPGIPSIVPRARPATPAVTGTTAVAAAGGARVSDAAGDGSEGAAWAGWNGSTDGRRANQGRTGAEESDRKHPIAALVDGPILLLRGTAAAPADPSLVLAAGEAPPKTRAPTLAPVPALPETAFGLSGSGATEELTRRLARELARAAAQGLVEPERRSVPDADVAGSGDVPLANVRIESAFDRAFGPAAEDAGLPVTTGPCLPAREFAVADWADDRPAATQIAEARAGLVHEFDRAEPEAVTALARVLVHFSFGAEARQVLAALGPDGAAKGILSELAVLVDSGGPGAPAIAGQIGCAGPGSLWAALSRAEIPDDVVIDTDRLLLSFMDLPPHLRRHLGPALVARFAAAGDRMAVEAISNAVARGTEPGDPARVLSEARADPEGLVPVGKIATLARGGRPQAGEALILLLDALLLSGDPIPRDLIDTAGILAFERAGTDEGRGLKAAQIRALLATGAYAEAFATLGRASETGILPEPFLGEVRQVALSALVEDAEDDAFLRRLLDPSGFRVARGAGRALKLAIAARLLDLGFADKAQEIAEPLSEATNTDELLYAARLSLAVGSPERAAEFARRARGKEAAEVEARALAAARRHREAAEIYAGMGDEARSFAESWRAGDWGRLARESAAPFAAAAASAVAASEDASRPVAATIAAMSERVEEAARLRAMIESLLQDVPDPATEARPLSILPAPTVGADTAAGSSEPADAPANAAQVPSEAAGGNGGAAGDATERTGARSGAAGRPAVPGPGRPGSGS